MIVVSSQGREHEISLLLKEACSYNDAQVRSWMLHQFDPSEVFCLYDGTRLAGLMRSLRRTFFFRSRKTEAAFLQEPLLLPEYNSPSNFSLLWNTVRDQALKSCLLVFYWETSPENPADPLFDPVFHQNVYSFSFQKSMLPDAGHIRSARSSDDLYSLYESFSEMFDGSIRLNPKDFRQNLRFAKSSKKRVMVHLDGSNLDGLYIARANGTRLEIETVFYSSAEALADIIMQEVRVWSSVDVHVSGSENLEAIFGVPPVREKTLMVKITSMELFNVWQNSDFQNYAQAFNSLTQPSWNGFI
ncbi:MAG: hypothetical protein HUJ54_13315 [Erysipelotrichaceae bacterium]|nr:hypothetical protein [Erysipelotrichaceae bacterium]